MSGIRESCSTRFPPRRWRHSLASATTSTVAALAPARAGARSRLGFGNRRVLRRRAGRRVRSRGRSRLHRRVARQGERVYEIAKGSRRPSSSKLASMLSRSRTLQLRRRHLERRDQFVAGQAPRPRRSGARPPPGRKARDRRHRQRAARSRSVRDATLRLWAACIAGAIPRNSYLSTLETAGFRVGEVRTNDYDFISERALNACAVPTASRASRSQQ